MLRLYRSRVRRGRTRAKLKRAVVDAIQTKGPHRDQKGRQSRERMLRLYRSRARRGMRRSTIKKTDVEAMQTKGQQRDDKGDNKESGCRGCIDQGLAEGVDWRQ